MPTIVLEDYYANWVNDNVIPLFMERGIKITTNAQCLIAFAMQSQVEEDVMSNDSLFNLAQNAAVSRLVKHYIEKYGEETLNFNRAFHLLADIRFSFPLGPTEPPPLTGTI